jgi:predicted xylan-binding protein with Ca-dependent carbohydrate-binding module/parallel beta helix pectate lyase-like protein
MSALRPALASLALGAITAMVVFTVSITPLASAADATLIEAEAMTVAPTNAGSTVRDSSASGGSALTLTTKGTASKVLQLPASTSVTVRAKGQQCNGAPSMTVAVDGVTIATTNVTSTAWTDYTTPKTLTAGSHTLAVTFTNPYWFFCSRNLSLDKVTVVPAATTTTSTTTPTTTTSPTTSPTSTSPTTTTSPTTPTSTTSTTTTTPAGNTSPPLPAGDNTVALQAIFDGIPAGGTLTLNKQTYQHSGVLKIKNAGVTIDGNGSTITATNDPTSAVYILGNNVSLSNVTLAAPLTGQRYTAPDQHKLVIEGSGDTVSDVSINGSAASGVFVYGASNFTLNRVSVKSSRADGIHMTNGSNNGTVNSPVTEATGDDGVAVVSYTGEPICHDIVINSPTVKSNTFGRGISVVGGQNISYRNISVANTYGAGVYIATEAGSSPTGSVNTVDVTGGTVTAANTSSQTVHGALLVYSGNGSDSVNNVTLSGLTVASTTSTAQRNAGVIIDAGTISKIAFNNIALQNTTLTPLYKSSNVPAGSVTTSGWTLNGAPITVN